MPLIWSDAPCLVREEVDIKREDGSSARRNWAVGSPGLRNDIIVKWASNGKSPVNLFADAYDESNPSKPGNGPIQTLVSSE